MTRSRTRDHPAVPDRDADRDRGRRFSIDIGRHLGTVEITVGGDLDALGCELLAGALSDLVDGQGNLDVIVDLGAVAHIETAALEAIAAAAHTNARRGGRLRITATMNPALTAAITLAVAARASGVTSTGFVTVATTDPLDTTAANPSGPRPVPLVAEDLERIAAGGLPLRATAGS